MNEKELKAYCKMVRRRAELEAAQLQEGKVRLARTDGMPTAKRKPGRPKETKHADTNKAWQTALCATIALHLNESYKAKVRHAARAALTTMRELAQDRKHWEEITEGSVTHMVYRLRREPDKAVHSSPLILMRAAIYWRAARSKV